jgi:hypothetical protein
MESDGITPHILNHCFGSESVSFMIKLLYHLIGGPQRLSRCYGEHDNLLPLPGIEPRLLSRPACSLVTILTELFQLCRRRVIIFRMANVFRTTCDGERELDAVSRRNESPAELRCAFYGIFKSTWKGVTLGHSAERTDISATRIPSTDKSFIWLAIT